MKKNRIHLFFHLCLVGCCWGLFGAGSMISAHAQTDSLPPNHRHIGILTRSFDAGNYTSSEYQDFEKSSSGYNFGLQLYYQNTNSKQIFKRIGISFGHGNSNLDLFNFRIDGTAHQTRSGRYTSLGFSLSMGRVVQFTKGPIWSRLRMQLGAGLSIGSPIASYQSNTYVFTDANGQVTTHFTEDRQRLLGALSLSPFIFVHPEFRIFKQCHLGIQWAVGPILEFQFGGGKVTRSNTGAPEVYSTSSFGLNWSGAISLPSVSIGYSF